MAVPDFQPCMLPLLRLAQSRAGSPVGTREAVEKLADEFHLTPEAQHDLLDSGKQRRFDNRVNWARSYLRKAALLESVGRGLESSQLIVELGATWPHTVGKSRMTIRAKQLAKFAQATTTPCEIPVEQEQGCKTLLMREAR